MKFIELLFFIWRNRKIITVMSSIKLFFANSKASKICKIYFKKYPYQFYLRTSTTDKSIFINTFLIKQHPAINNNTNILVDIGANIGAVSFLYKMQNPNINIIAVEPDKSNCVMYKKNMHYFNNVELIETAVHNTEGIQMYLENPTSGSSGFRYAENINKAKYNSTISTSINQIIKNYGLNKIDVVKIDIEGGEKILFQKNLDWLKITDKLIIELHDHYVDGCSTNLIKALSQYELKLKWMGENLIITFKNR